MKIPLSLILPLCILLIVSLSVNGVLFWQHYQAKVVVAVPDGDSLDLKNGTRIRLLGIDAPERNRCGHDQAKQNLTALTLGKIIRIEEVVRDDYGRQLANVYVGTTLINELLVREGYVRYTSVKSSQSERLKQAKETAVSEMRGIYSPLCRSTIPNTDCIIKGNIKDHQKIYHTPKCKNYDQTIVDLSYGDQWFCTEKEAIENGFVKPEGCL